MMADGGPFELLGQLPGGVEIHQVVVGKFLAVQLFGAGDALSGAAVEGGRLVRILAVAQAHQARGADGEVLRERAGIVHLFEAGADGGIVIGGGAEDLFGQAPFGGEREFASVGAEFRDDGVIVGRGDDDGDILVVLGRRAQHGGAADIDVLDQFLEGRAGFGGGFLEAVEVDHDHVDGGDAVGGDGGHVGGVGAHGEDAAGDDGVKGLDAAVEHFGEAGDLADVLDGDAGIAEQAGGAAGGEKFGAQGVQRAGEIDDAGLVGDTEKYA